MLNDLQEHLDKILSIYCKDKYYDEVVEARKKYFEVTGQANEEDDDYEARMLSFNDWFIMHYLLASGKTAFADYIETSELDETIKSALEGFRYSVFEFTGKNFSGKFVVKDLLSNEKHSFTKDSSVIPVFKGDIFTGRIFKANDDFYLMNGICLLPKEGKSFFKKQIKKVRKLGKKDKEDVFLLQLENLKTKWKRFGHVDASKIFTFDS